MRLLLLWMLCAGLAGADPLTENMVKIARQEWDFFGQQTIVHGQMVKEGHRETDEGYWQRVGTYWKEALNLPHTGKNTDEAWSAAFISWVMKTAGLGDRFLYDEWHAHYINRAIQAREQQDPRYAFYGFRLSERPPQVGDLVCYAREDGVDFDHRPETYKSHCDLVVAVRPGEIDVIGGNVADSVTLKTLKTNPGGLLIDTNNRWFAVLHNRL